MNDALAELFRRELRELRPYQAAQYAEGLVRLNANETPWRPSEADDSLAGLNRYPEVRPEQLTRRLAAHYQQPVDRVLVTRGSSEGIELLIRALCRPGEDDIMICPPTFGMYEAYAQIQGAGVRRVPLRRDAGFALDIKAIRNAWSDRCKLLFVCSPNNPTGNAVPGTELDELCRSIGERGLVVMDGAYLEFASDDPTPGLLERHANFVVLRTLSKALGLAGVRCGVTLAAPLITNMLDRILPPYSLSTPCTDAVLAALDEAAAHKADIEGLKVDRERLAAALTKNPRVRRIWPSEANFILIESPDAAALVKDARAGGVLIRDFSSDPATPGCVRITVGTAAQNQQLLEALAPA